MSKRTLPALLVLLILTVAGIFTTALPGEYQNQPASLVSNLASRALLGENGIYVTDQPSADFITISDVTMRSGGFVVIQDNENGTPQAIVGVSEYMGGSAADLHIRATRPTKSGEVLFAVLYGDDGDKKFDSGRDRPVLEMGLSVMAQFKIVAGAI